MLRHADDQITATRRVTPQSPQKSRPPHWSNCETQDVSRTKKPRPAYQRMLADVRAGKIQAVVSGTSTGSTASRASSRTSSTSPTRSTWRWRPCPVTPTCPPTWAASRQNPRQREPRRSRTQVRTAEAGQQTARRGRHADTVHCAVRIPPRRQWLALEPAEAMMLRDAYSAILAGAACTPSPNSGTPATCRRGAAIPGRVPPCGNY